MCADRKNFIIQGAETHQSAPIKTDPHIPPGVKAQGMDEPGADTLNLFEVLHARSLSIQAVRGADENCPVLPAKHLCASVASDIIMLQNLLFVRVKHIDSHSV